MYVNKLKFLNLSPQKVKLTMNYFIYLNWCMILTEFYHIKQWKHLCLIHCINLDSDISLLHGNI